MKYSIYIAIKKGKINKFGKIEYKTVSESVYTDDIVPYNHGKKIRFKPIRVPHKSKIYMRLQAIRTRHLAL